MKDDTIIGILNDYDYETIITIEDLNEHIKDPLCVYTINQYCDCRYGTDLTRFSYDPYTGEKIIWKEVKNILNSLN